MVAYEYVAFFSFVSKVLTDAKTSFAVQLTSQEREEALSCVWPTSFNFPLVQPTATHKRFRSEEVEETDDQQMGSASKRPRLEVIEEVNGAD